MTHPTPPRHRAQPATLMQRLINARHDDEGSLLLVILFTLMMTALVLVVVGTMITGLHKTKDSREYSVALQAADAAFADAQMRAEMDPAAFQNPLGATGQGTVLGSTVQWTWTATANTSPANTWTVDVQATGTHMHRHFSAYLKGTQVTRGIQNADTGDLHYQTAGTENYGFGFFGTDNLTVTPSTAAPVIDGYSNKTGEVGSNGTLALGAAAVPQIDEWGADGSNPTPCTGTACGTANINQIRSKALLDDTTINAYCNHGLGGHYVDVDWNTSTGPLRAGWCYKSITFDADYNAPVTGGATPGPDGVVYSEGPISVAAGVTVNGAYASNAPSWQYRFATKSTYTQAAGSRIAAAVYAPLQGCSITNTTPAYATIWLGAATCKTLTINGSARLRYDGGLDAVNAVDPNDLSQPWVWELYGYKSLD